jgi:hypothetical protein
MAIALAVIMLAIVAWGVFVEGGATRIIIDGQELTWPFKGAIGAAEMIVASVALFCAAIFLVFVVAGLAFSFWGVLLPQVSSCPGLRSRTCCWCSFPWPSFGYSLPSQGINLEITRDLYRGGRGKDVRGGVALAYS